MSAYPVIAPKDWYFGYDPVALGLSKSHFYQIGWVGHEFDPALCRSWSMSAPDDNTVRFEIRQGDVCAWDGPTKSERAELSAFYDGANNVPKGLGRVPIRTPTIVKYGLTVEPGPQNTSPWFVFSQFHEDQVVGSPPISVCLDNNSDVMTVNRAWTNATGKAVNGPIWKDTAPIQRGHRYQMLQYMYVDPDGNGRLIVYRDNIKIVDFTGAIGYIGQTNSFWKIGLYRHGPTVETIAAKYDNMTFIAVY